MKNQWILAGLAGALLATLAGGRPGAAAPAMETLELNGLLVDNACVEEHKSDLLAYVKTHPKACALKPEHQAAGYSLITPDGLVTPFEPQSNSRIAKYLKQSKSKLSVTVKARLKEEKLELVSIKDLVRPKPPKAAETVKPGK